MVAVHSMGGQARLGVGQFERHAAGRGAAFRQLVAQGRLIEGHGVGSDSQAAFRQQLASNGRTACQNENRVVLRSVGGHE